MSRAKVFDAIRERMGQVRLEWVPIIDQALDKIGMPRDGAASTAAVASGRAGNAIRSPSAACIALIKRFEGCGKRLPDGNLQAYPDPGTGGAPWTIGWGSTTDGTGRLVKPGDIWTQAQADARLAQDVNAHAAEVIKALGDAPTTQNQFDALVSFHYNTGAIASATLTKKHKARDYAGAAKEFARWNRAGGRVLKGLVTRRAAEAELYRRG